MFSSFFHFGLYPTPLISYIAVPHFFFDNRHIGAEWRISQCLWKIIELAIIVEIDSCNISDKYL